MHHHTQVCPYDCRHTLATLAAAAAAAGPDSSSGRPPAASALAEPGAAPPAAASSAAAAPPAQPLVMYVYEEEPELLARHMMLTYALLSGALPPRERVEAFLELHGGALLRARTAAWLGECQCYVCMRACPGAEPLQPLARARSARRERPGRARASALCRASRTCATVPACAQMKPACR